MPIMKNSMQGKVVAYRIAYLPATVEHFTSAREDNRGDEVTVHRSPKITAVVEIKVDGKKYFARSKASEAVLKSEGDERPEAYKQVFNTLVDLYPRDSEQEFLEVIIPRSKGRPMRRYEMKEK